MGGPPGSRRGPGPVEMGPPLPRARTALKRPRAAAGAGEEPASPLAAGAERAPSGREEAVVQDGPAQEAQEAVAPDRPAWCGSSRARLVRLELQAFRSFERRAFDLASRSTACIVGPNSCGKSSVLDAIRFVLLRCQEDELPQFIQQGGPEGDPEASVARVDAHFEAPGRPGTVLLRREAHCNGRGGCESRFWLGDPERAAEQVSRASYAAWISEALLWADGDLLLRQFALLRGTSAAELLRQLPGMLDSLQSQAEAANGGGAPSLLKRRGGSGVQLPRKARAGGLVSAAAAAEAWVARRVDEVFRELTRRPLDDVMEEWGDGGQACLRRSENGSFSLFVSEQRGAAASGYGKELPRLSDGLRDVCALALGLALPGLPTGLRDSLPPFVVLDEPDSHMDKQHARALLRFLSGPKGPQHCILLSLNNHAAFDHCAIRL